MDNQAQISTVIARADAKGKILDFRDNLIMADKTDYAMMHGIGGANHAPNSCIKVVITDYSAGTGENSTTVSGNIRPEVMEAIREVCCKNIGSPKSDTLLQTRTGVQTVGKMFQTLLTKLWACVKGAEPGNAICFGSALQETLQEISAFKVKQDELELYWDYSLMQEKVNVYKNDGGYVPVSSVRITRTGKVNGELRRLPWTVKIANFSARPKPQTNGTTAYDGSSVKDKKEVFISLSDDDMFRCATRVCRFVTAWENARCIPLIISAEAEREALRMNREYY